MQIFNEKEGERKNEKQAIWKAGNKSEIGLDPPYVSMQQLS